MTPEQRKARAYLLRTKYNMTIEEYEALLEFQQGVCAICDRPPKEGKNLQVDHDHVTSLIRGLLCWSCNHRFIGRERNPVRFDRGASYLRHPPAQTLMQGRAAPPKNRKKRSTKNG